MRKQLRISLTLWLLMVFSIAAGASDLPETLYMAQTSYSSTARASATGTDGVYSFSLASSSSTTAPKYYIFTTGSSAANAKKPDAKLYGASAVEDGSNIMPVFGKVYPLKDLSGVDNATAIQSQPMCAFMPIYCTGTTIEATVNLNDMTVVFSRQPAEDAPLTLGIFDATISNALASAPLDADGIARYSVKLASDALVYFAANTTKRAETSTRAIWGAATSASPANTPVTSGQTYPLVRSTYYQVYSTKNCSFSIPAGDYDIIADTQNGTIEFAPFTGMYRPKPDKLYMRTHLFGSTAQATATGDNGVYRFTYDKSTSSTTEPFRLVFTEATSYTAAQNAAWVLGSTTEDTNICPEYGKVYPLVDLNASTVYNTATGTFMPLYPQKYEIVVDLNALTVCFTPTETLGPLSELKMCNMSGTTLKELAAPTVGDDGKLHYSFRGTAGTQAFFTTAPNRTAMPLTNVLNFSAGGHATPAAITVAVGSSHTAHPTSYRRLYTDKNDYFELPGKCDITFDPDTYTITFEPYTGRYDTYPATLYMRSSDFGTKYAEAAGEEGVYKFRWDKSTSTTAEPYRIVFTEATSYDKALTALWVMGAPGADTCVVPEYGKSYPLADVDPATVHDSGEGSFMPVYPMNYEIVVSLKDKSVRFNALAESIDPMTSLTIMGQNGKPVAKPVAGKDGRICYSFRGTAGTKVFFSTGTTTAELKTPGTLIYSIGGLSAPAGVTTEYGKSYQIAPSVYKYVYYDKTDYIELPGRCDIELDPATMSFSISPYTGTYDVYPETLYIKLNTFSTTHYGTATGEDGVYTFQYTTQTINNNPRYIVFTDATSSSTLNSASWVLGASADGSRLTVAPGMETDLYDLDILNTDIITGKEGTFIPFYPYTYTITVDIKNRKVKWGDPLPLPSKLRLLDDRYGEYARTAPDNDGVYNFETVTYSRHPLYISDASSLSELRTSPWIFMSSSYDDAANTDIADGAAGAAGNAERTTSFNVNYIGQGFWMTPEGCNRLRASLDPGKGTISWNVTPVVPRDIEVLYLVNTELKPISKAISDDTGIFDFEVNLKSGTSVAFSDSDTGKNDPGRTFYGSGAPYNGSRITPQADTDYTLYLTSGEAVAGNYATYYLAQGKWRIHIDVNLKTIRFEDVTRGGTWYIPESLDICDDDLNVIASGVKSEEGVFTFTGVEISSDRPLTKTVFADPGEKAGLFGANATGEIGPAVESGTVYDLYMPENLWVTTDGASCFGLTPASYDITVNFNDKTVKFVDPAIPVYPGKIELMQAGDNPVVLMSAEGDGSYVFTLRNSAATEVYLRNPEDGTLYGAAEAGATVESGAAIGVAEAAQPLTILIPEGVWTMTFSLKDMTAAFRQTTLPVFTGTSMPSGTTFHSYFGAGTDPKAVFTFNNNIEAIDGAWVVLGNYSGGKPAAGDKTALGLRTAAIDGNRLILGFEGQTYAIPEGADKKVHIVISGVRDTNGEYLVSEPLSGLSSGSLVFEYPFSEFKRIYIDGKFDPAPGSDIDETATLRLKVNRFDDITFSDIMFSRYVATRPEDNDGTEETHCAAAQWKRGETDADGYTELLIDVPMKMRGLGRLKVTLENLDIDDNYSDHADDVSALYFSHVNPTEVFTSTPAQGSTVGTVEEITLTWNHPLIASVGNMASEAVIVNRATNEPVAVTYSYPSDERSITLTPASPIDADGTYDLLIDEGELVFNDNPASGNNPIALGFTVDPSLGIAGLTISETDDVEVVNLSGVVVRRGKGSSTLEGLTGIYIVNGVKCLLPAASGMTRINK